LEIFISADLCQNRIHITRRGLIGTSNSIASSAASLSKPSPMHLVGRRATAPTLTIRVMSGFQLLHDGVELQLPETGERVLAVLAVKGRPLPRLKLSAMFWPDASEKQALANLRSVLWRLSGPSHDALDIRPRSLSIAASVRVDLRTSEALAHQILDRTSVLTDDQLGAATAHFQEDLLAGWYDDWAVQESERWRQLRVHALEAAARRLRECGSYAAALDTALLAVEADPVRESAHTEVIKTHLAEHNQSEAIRAYDRCSAVLREELGLEPSEYLRALVGPRPAW
jgi:DNA-binding SARP family transcriptional activator